MRLESRLLGLKLVPASLLLGMATAASAQDGGAHGHAHDHAEAAPAAPASAMRTLRWSDATSWPDGKVPAAGSEVVIGRDMHVVLDVAAPVLRSLTIDGKLSFSDKMDIELQTEWIYLRRGTLEIGSEAKPHTRKATITLTDNVPGENVGTMGDRGILLIGGTLSLHGDRQHTWTKLAKTAKAGSNKIEVLDASGWRKGDEIVLASTDFDPRQAEKRTVTAIRGNVLTLDRKLEYMHFGEITFGVDQRGEVGLLTRNIRVRASEDADKNYFGGHIMAMPASKVQVSGVELTRMGQHLKLARYPMHWHLVGEGKGQYIQNSAIHDTYSRCVTVHGTNNVRVENNVTYNTVGHCFFLEDAVETGNQFIRNLGIQTKCHPTLPCIPTNLAPGRPVGASAGQKSEHVLIPSDNTAATFWITNPDNIYRDNVAAGSDQIGFWFALPIHPTGEFEGTAVSANTWPRRTRLREFKGNVAHSNFDGIMFDRGPAPDGSFSVVGSNYHVAFTDPTDTNSQPLESVFEDFTGYKNRNGAIWGRGELHLFKNLKLADNAIGFTHASAALGRYAYTSRVVDSLFVGESDNIGNPRTPEEIAYGRSLPTEHADYPIRGYEYYDFRHDVEDVTFLNFEDNATRQAGAISYLMYTSFGISTENAVERVTFKNAKPVHFPSTEQKWASDFGSRNGWRGAAFRDKDGSVGGVPNAYIVLDNGIASDEEGCEIRPTWNAAICTGDIGRVSVGSAGGGFGAPSGQPAPAPIVLSRNGRQFEYSGETTIRSGTEVRVDTARTSTTLALREMDDGAWVIFELPGFTTAATGVEQSSLAALRAASTTSYYKNGDTLWVKLVVPNVPTESGPRSGLAPRASIEVSR